MSRVTEGFAVSRPPARHQKPGRHSSSHGSSSGRHDPAGHRGPAELPRGHAQHRKQRAGGGRLKRKPVKIAAAVAGSTLLVSGAAPVVAHWHRLAAFAGTPDQTNSSGLSTANATGPQQAGAPMSNSMTQWSRIPVAKLNASQAATKLAADAKRKPPRHAATRPSVADHRNPAPKPQPQPHATETSAYENPLRSVGGLVLERVDQGVDFGGSGPVYAIGDGVVTNATADSSGWPGGGWITYQITNGPDSGLVVYLAEDVTPTVQVGQTVTSSTVIANMFNGGAGIETGWATSDGSTAESQMPAAGGINGAGPFPTMVGLSFEALLESLGVPAAPNADQPGNGLLPAGYPPT
jgi:murein DD-endopeptidase MepM/ murein hydrolase activator NlpD